MARENPDEASFFKLNAGVAKFEGPMTVNISNTYHSYYNQPTPRKQACYKKE